MKLKNVQARKILNSVGAFSIEVIIETDKGAFIGSAPKGTSKGKHEVKEYTTTVDAAIKSVNTKIKRLLKRTKINKV